MPVTMVQTTPSSYWASLMSTVSAHANDTVRVAGDWPLGDFDSCVSVAVWMCLAIHIWWWWLYFSAPTLPLQTATSFFDMLLQFLFFVSWLFLLLINSIWSVLSYIFCTLHVSVEMQLSQRSFSSSFFVFVFTDYLSTSMNWSLRVTQYS